MKELGVSLVGDCLDRFPDGQLPAGEQCTLSCATGYKLTAGEQPSVYACSNTSVPSWVEPYLVCIEPSM